MLPELKDLFFKENGEMYKTLLDDTQELKIKLESSLDNLSQGLNQVKQYQTEIEEARDFWQWTFDAVESPIAILDHHSRIKKANCMFLKTVKLDHEFIMDRIICEIFCNVTNEEFSPCGECCTREIIQKNGHIYKVKFNKIVDENRNLKGCVFVAYDITEERNTQEHLLEVSRKYQSIFATAGDAIILIEAETKNIIEANPAATKIYGYHKHELVGKNAMFLSAEPEKTNQALACKVEHIPLRFHKRKNGTIVPVEISASYYTYNEKEYCISIIRDVSDRISTEAVISLHEYADKLK